MLDQSQPDPTSPDDTDTHLMKTPLPLIAEKPNLAVVEAVSGGTGAVGTRANDAPVAPNNNGVLKRDLRITVEPYGTGQRPTS